MLSQPYKPTLEVDDKSTFDDKSTVAGFLFEVEQLSTVVGFIF
jgi:hypothetical protein